MTARLKDLWTSAAWKAEVAAWISAELNQRQILVTGPMEQPRVQAWSTQLTVPTDAGLMWFKVNNPGQSFEAALVEAMAPIVPDHLVAPVAVDHERGWLLSPDQGPTLGSLPTTDEHLWARVVTDFGDLQRRVSGHAAELTGAGLSSLPPSQVVSYIEEQVSLLTTLPHPDHRRMKADDADIIRQFLPRVTAAADRLTAASVPLSLEHNDLHHNNAFLPNSDTEPLRFFDFGDSLWAHPFTSMRIVLNVALGEWEAEATDKRVRFITDAYLDGWTNHGSRAELRELLADALLLGPVHRMVSWLRVLDHADADDLVEFGQAPALWLRMISEPVPFA